MEFRNSGAGILAAHLLRNRLTAHFEKRLELGLSYRVEVYGRNEIDVIPNNADIAFGSRTPSSRFFMSEIVEENNTRLSFVRKLKLQSIDRIEVRNVGSSSRVRSQVIVSNKSTIEVRFEVNSAELILFSVRVYGTESRFI